ncbi:MAG: FAD-dependent oxidoreductase [Cyanobacteria bacterium]|nr:FAD-dependent oxidoreductase [Cyanobacteriota bacterium]
MRSFTTDILIIGGTTSGTAAAIQAARRGIQVILVSEFEWLGGMLTSAGVAAPDGNELQAWQTGIWGEFLEELKICQPGGLDNAWVSFFTYEPRIGAEIFERWVTELPNLKWIQNQTPRSVQRSGNQITGVTTDDCKITAKITIDATELGDLLPLGDIPHRWGWDSHDFNEPSAPTELQDWMKRYPIQVPTWVVVLKDYGEGQTAPAIEAPNDDFDLTQFEQAWENYGGEKFLNYGRLPGDRFMINWPIHGNDYGEGVDRLIQSQDARFAYGLEAQRHSLAFAYWIQQKLGMRYGLATDVFPPAPNDLRSIENHHHRLHPALALHPYHRESRRIIGLTTVREQDLLPQGQRNASLPFTISGMGCDRVEQVCTAIAIGNYANDHHYPSGDIPLAPKSIKWGGRWTGTPFTIPYTALIPEQIDGFLACEKNISVTHMANGATRLQPLVLNLGQATGMAAALCVEQACQPRNLPVRSLQTALINDPIAPAAVIPLYNQPLTHPKWKFWQQYYLDNPEAYSRQGDAPSNIPDLDLSSPQATPTQFVTGKFIKLDENSYQLEINSPVELGGRSYHLVTTHPEIDRALRTYSDKSWLSLQGRLNLSGGWIFVESIDIDPK